MMQLVFKLKIQLKIEFTKRSSSCRILQYGLYNPHTRLLPLILMCVNKQEKNFKFVLNITLCNSNSRCHIFLSLSQIVQCYTTSYEFKVDIEAIHLEQNWWITVTRLI